MAVDSNSTEALAGPDDAVDTKALSTLAQIKELRAQAKTGGLRFVAYLPPGLAEWMLDQIEDGFFADPREAVFAIVGLYRELEPHTMPREQLLRQACAASVFDMPQPSIPGEDVRMHVRALFDNPPAAPAVWRNGTDRPR